MKHPLLLSLPTKITSERLYLRHYQDDDGSSFYNLLQENKEHLEATVHEVKSIKSVEDAEIRNRKLYADWVSRNRYVLPIFDITSDEMIGEIWIEPVKWKLGIYELGYFVIAKYEGKGFATEASKLALDFIFNHLNANKVEIHTDDINTKSYAVAERLGFKKEGLLRNRDETMGKIVGRLYYGLLKSEYEETRS